MQVFLLSFLQIVILRCSSSAADRPTFICPVFVQFSCFEDTLDTELRHAAVGSDSVFSISRHLQLQRRPTFQRQPRIQVTITLQRAVIWQKTNTPVTAGAVWRSDT